MIGLSVKVLLTGVIIVALTTIYIVVFTNDDFTKNYKKFSWVLFVLMCLGAIMAIGGALWTIWT